MSEGPDSSDTSPVERLDKLSPREARMDKPARHALLRIAGAGVGVVVPFIVFHWEILTRTVRVALHDPDWSHALVVPFISLWLVYRGRDRFRRLKLRPFAPGLLVLLGGMGLYVLALYPIRNAMLEAVALVVNVAGVVLFLFGPDVMRAAWFPLVYLLFVVRISDKIWHYLSWKLQMLSARLAAFLLVVVGVDVRIRGAVIEVWRGLDLTARLNVEDACSGLRMIVAFMALGALLAYMRRGAGWKRVLLFLSTIPVAVFVNAVRVTISGLLAARGIYAAAGLSHAIVGLLMMAPAVALFYFLGWFLDAAFPEPSGDFSVDSGLSAQDTEDGPGGRS